MPQKIAIVDYSAGNIHSVVKKIIRLNALPLVCHNADELMAADKIILPGVGHFGTAINQLKSTNLLEVLQHRTLEQKTPVLGICLGMQLMAQTSEEAPGVHGLRWINAEVVRFRQTDNHTFRTPHTGWNRLKHINPNSLIRDVAADSEFYFTHAYHLISYDDLSWNVAQTNYGYSFLSAIANDNIFGVQFHPEKSHEAGEKLMKNFLSL